MNRKGEGQRQRSTGAFSFCSPVCLEVSRPPRIPAAGGAVIGCALSCCKPRCILCKLLSVGVSTIAIGKAVNSAKSRVHVNE